MLDPLESLTAPTLIVGTGLTGAMLAWLASHAGRDVLVVSSDRPSSQGTALAAGVVHGLGPPGGPLEWLEMSEVDFADALRRDRKGYDDLREVLIRARRPVGFIRRSHECVLSKATQAKKFLEAESRMRAAGFPVESYHREDGVLLRRSHDAVVNPRRLTFALLSQARAVGARILLGRNVRLLSAEQDVRGITVDIGGRRQVFREVYWATNRLGKNLPSSRRESPRVVLYQELEEGEARLPGILEACDGAALLVPSPQNPRRNLFVRVARDLGEGGLDWPEPPNSWTRYRGRAIRQRLSELVVGSRNPGEAIPVGGSGYLFDLAGLSHWPVAALFGICRDALLARSGHLEPSS